MRNFGKRIVTALLAAVMVTSCLPMPVLAEDLPAASATEETALQEKGGAEIPKEEIGVESDKKQELGEGTPVILGGQDATPEEVPATPEEVPATPEEVPATPEEVPATPEEVPASAEQAAMATPRMLFSLRGPESQNLIAPSPEGVPGYEFKWADDGDTTDAGPEICYYTDDYFKDANPATTYNPQLAGASMCLTMSAFGSVELGTTAVTGKDYTKQSQNAKNLLTELGFAAPTCNDAFNDVPTADSIGCVAGYKIIGEGSDAYAIIAVGVRGSNYKSEWASNVTIGAEDNHAGFDKAATDVLAFVAEYVAAHEALKNCPRAKFWVTGFSRAAATSNLTAAKLNQDIQARPGEKTRIGMKINSIRDVYAYTFEAPAGYLTAADATDPSIGYENIFNIINPQDLVPMVAPVSLNFRRYGVDKVLPGKENHPNYAALQQTVKTQATARDRKIGFDLLERMMVYPDMTRYDIYSAVYPTQGLFFADFVANLSEDGIGKRADYLTKGEDGASLQEGMQDLMATFMRDEGVTIGDFKNMAFGMFQTKYIETAGSLIKTLCRDGFKAAYPVLRDWMAAGARDKGVTTIDEAFLDSKSTDFKLVLSMLGRQLGGSAFLLPSLITNEILAMKVWPDAGGSEHVSTGHSVALCKTWLEVMDPNYVTEPLDPATTFTNGKYRRISLSRAYIEAYGDGAQTGVDLAPLGIEVKDDASGATWNFSEDGLLTEGEAAENGPAMMTFGTEGTSCMSVVYLPYGRSYTVTILQTHRVDWRTICFKLEEYDPTLPKQVHIGQMERQIVWNNDPGVNWTQRKYIMKVPAAQNEAENDYQLLSYDNGSDVSHTVEKSSDIKRITPIDDRLVELDVRIAPDYNYGYAGELGETLHVKPAQGSTGGDQAYLLASPAEGCRFAGWYQGDVLLSADPNYTYPITSETPAGTLVVEARFAQIPPAPPEQPAAPAPAVSDATVHAWCTAGGTVVPGGIVTVKEGESAALQIFPAAGYRVTKVLVDGVDVGPVNGYEFRNLQGSHELGVYFDLDPAAAKTAGGTSQGGQNTAQEKAGTETADDVPQTNETAATQERAPAPEISAAPQVTPAPETVLPGAESETAGEQAPVPEKNGVPVAIPIACGGLGLGAVLVLLLKKHRAG